MPGDFITHFLNKKYSALCERELEPPKLCDLKSFDFTGKGPDYTKRLLRDFYYVKYSSAYITEYFLCYNRIFSKGFLLDGNSVSTLSLGCGAMLDLVGFEYARKKSEQFSKSKPFYYGVDIIDWKCDETNVIEDITFFSKGIENFKATKCQQYFDIICFPKSLSDIPTKFIINFANSLTKNDVQNKFCVIISKRGESITDSEVGRQFVDTISQNLSFKVTKEERDDILTSDSDYFEDHLENPFTFNRGIGSFLQELGERCGSCECENNQRCKEIVSKWPMRKVTKIFPEIYYLEEK